MMTTPVKQAIQNALRSLSDDCSWEEAMYAIYVRREIEAGLLDIEEGRVIDHDDVLRELGLDEEDHLVEEIAGPPPADSPVHTP
jgi:predicted transcriptional regulator